MSGRNIWAIFHGRESLSTSRSGAGRNCSRSGLVRVGADPAVTVHKLHGALVEWY